MYRVIEKGKEMKRICHALLILVLVCLSLGSDCEPPEDIPWIGGDDDQPVKNMDFIEVDHQMSFCPFYPYDVVAGTTQVKSYFPSECELKFKVSNTGLVDQAIGMHELGSLVYAYIEKDEENCQKYRYYLLGIKHLQGTSNGNDYRFSPGVLFRGVVTNCPDSLIYSIVCVEVCQDYDSDWASLGTTVHELGHSVGRLSHYCLDSDETTINWQDHDAGDLSCIMGNSFEPACGEPTLADIHFCSKCIDNLKAAKR